MDHRGLVDIGGIASRDRKDEDCPLCGTELVLRPVNVSSVFKPGEDIHRAVFVLLGLNTHREMSRRFLVYLRVGVSALSSTRTTISLWTGSAAGSSVACKRLRKPLFLNIWASAWAPSNADYEDNDLRLFTNILLGDLRVDVTAIPTPGKSTSTMSSPGWAPSIIQQILNDWRKKTRRVIVIRSQILDSIPSNDLLDLPIATER